MRAKRLHRLANFLEEKVPNKRFDLDIWADSTDLSMGKKCGTVGCACGWGTLIFNGLTLKEDCGWGDTEICYHGETGFAAIEKLFGISYEDVQHLFDSISYKQPTKYNVIRRIRSFIKKNTKSGSN